MGKRKGKKAWRANISTEDIEDFYEKSTKDSLTGGSLASAPNDSLFFLDNSQDLSAKRKIDKHREKVLRCDSLLQKNPFVQPVAPSVPKKFKKQHNKLLQAKDATKNGPKESVIATDMVDLWDDKGAADNGKIKKISKPSIISAVEVDPPGCSFNPSSESHQEVLACAVAEEMQKVYKNELGPQPVPLTVPGEVIGEEDIYFIEAEDDSDDNMDPDNVYDNEDDAEKRPRKMRRVTKAELNKRARNKEQLRKESEAKKLADLSRKIDSLPDILQEIAKEDKEKQKRHLRRVVAKQEKLKSHPPRLGKHKFEPAPMQVLLSEEITGSLRQIKGCCTLAKDRFKSLEKRGLIPPSAKSRRK